MFDEKDVAIWRCPNAFAITVLQLYSNILGMWLECGILSLKIR